MYRIVGRDNLQAINNMAEECMFLLNRLEKDSKDSIHIDKFLVQRMAHGFLYMYNKSIEHSIMPGIKARPNSFDEYIQ